MVRVWFRALGKESAPPHRKLNFLYLANDVVQNSKKKFPDYAKEFGTVIKKVIQHLAAIAMDEKIVKSIGRLLNIWKERTIFDPKIQTDMSRIWAKKAIDMKSAESAAADATTTAATTPDKAGVKRQSSSKFLFAKVQGQSSHLLFSKL